MAAEIWVEDNDVKRRIKEWWVEDNGVKRKIKEGWVCDNGVQRCFFRGENLNLQNRFITSTRFSPANPAAAFELTNAGIQRGLDVSTVQFSELFVDPGSAAPTYECLATVLSGTFNSGTFGTWLALSTTRAWSLSTSIGGQNKSALMRIDIRKIGTTPVMATADISFFVEKSI